MHTINTEELVDDLRDVIESTTQLLHATAGSAGEKVAQARVQAERSLETACKRLRTVEKRVVGRARTAVRRTDRYVHTYPWNSIGVAAGFAFLLGWLTARR